MRFFGSIPARSPDERLHVRRLQWMLGGRVAVATVLLGATLYFAVDAIRYGAFTPTFLLMLISLIYASSIIFGAWLLRGGSTRLVTAAMLALDMLLITGLLYLTGGAGSIFSILYGVQILMSAIALGSRAAYLVAAMSLVLHVGLGVGLAAGWINSPPDQPLSQYLLSPSDLSYALLSNLVGIGVVAILAASLADRVQQTGGRLIAAELSAARLAQLNDDIVRSISSGLITADNAGHILAVNPAAREILRDPSGSLVGEPLSRIVPDSVANETTSQRRAEGLARRADGSEFAMGYSVGTLVDADGHETGRLLAFQDLTEIHELQEKAEQAERLAVLGRVAVGLAHEIRNPLSSISGSVEMVHNSHTLEQEDRRLLRIVIEEVERLDQLVTNMLQVGRPSIIQPEKADLRRLVNDVVAVARAQAVRSLGLVIEADVPDEPVYAAVDLDRMRQLVWNLVKNAMQASPQGERIDVRVGRDSDESVFLEVADRGPGIDPDQREHLFDMFYSGRVYGVGMGLALVKQIVEQHGAHIEAHDREGGGTCFRVSLVSRESKHTDSTVPFALAEASAGPGKRS